MASKFRKVDPVKPPSRSPLTGLDRWECKTHGFVVDAIKGTHTAICRCGRQAKVSEEGPEREEA